MARDGPIVPTPYRLVLVPVPVLPVTGEVFDEVQLDGFSLRTGWVLLIASVGGKPVAYQWAGSENQAAWSALLAQAPAPVVVVSDGASGLKGALAEHWPDTRVSAQISAQSEGKPLIGRVRSENYGGT